MSSVGRAGSSGNDVPGIGDDTVGLPSVGANEPGNQATPTIRQRMSEGFLSGLFSRSRNSSTRQVGQQNPGSTSVALRPRPSLRDLFQRSGSGDSIPPAPPLLPSLQSAARPADSGPASPHPSEAPTLVPPSLQGTRPDSGPASPHPSEAPTLIPQRPSAKVLGPTRNSQWYQTKRTFAQSFHSRQERNNARMRDAIAREDERNFLKKLESGADPAAPSSRHRNNAFHLLADHPSPRVVEKLSEWGSDNPERLRVALRTLNADGQSPIHLLQFNRGMAIGANNTSVVDNLTRAYNAFSERAGDLTTLRNSEGKLPDAMVEAGQVHFDRSVLEDRDRRHHLVNAGLL